MPNPALYTVGLITAITTEFAATCAMLDSEEEEGPDYVSPGDTNSYTLGTMGKHNVVIASLPHGDYGTSSAAAIASNMLNSFPNVRIGLMIGIGGGAPTAKHDIRLGDIVVSARDGDSSIGSVFQYDFGKAIPDQDFKTTRLLNQPPPALLAALSNLRQFYDRKGGHTLENDIEGAFIGSPGIQRTHSRPNPTTDRLYISEYVHNASCCADSGGENDDNLVIRAPRKEGEGMSVIHYGVIASANQLMKDAKLRDKLAETHGVLCFEMEAAGLMNHFPCLVVRGICDYSDSHKNKQWQGYAAMMAAAYAKSLLKRIAPTRIEQERKLSEIINGVEGSVKVMYATTQDMHASINHARVEYRDDKIHNWLSHPDLDPSANYNKARQERIKDSTSGQWFIQNEAFTKWKLRRNSSLWLYGITGCGKTVLVSTVLEHLERTYENVLYFYFDFAQERKQSVDGMIRWLISQLNWKSKSSRKHIDFLYQSHQNGKVQPDLRSLCESFQAMLNKSGEVYIILDALDECKIRRDPDGYPGGGLLSWIQALVSCETANIHLILTSRPEHDIKSALNEWMGKEDMLPIESGLISADIQNYVHTKVREHKGLERWHGRPHVQEEIESALLKRANGMFRWVACQLQSLEQCLDLPTLRDTLNSLPITLDETYARVLSNLPKTTRHLTVRILQFLTYSERPLQIAEVVDMVVVQTDPKREDSWFKKESRLPLPEEITKYCSSLVKVIIKNKHRNGVSITGSIQLAHLSVKDYLVSNRLEPMMCNEFQEIFAKTCIIEVCLAYLLALPNKTPVDKIIVEFPFARFAAQNWAAHAAFVEDRSESTLFFVEEFFSRETSYRLCGELRNLNTLRTLDSTQIPWRLHYAIMNGLPRSVQMLLDQTGDASDKGKKLSGLLTIPFRLERKEFPHIEPRPSYQSIGAMKPAVVARGLVTSGANVDDHESLLHAAVSGGYDEIVKLLLDKRADVNTGNRPVLIVASKKGYKNIVQRLLEHGADPNAIYQETFRFEFRPMFHSWYIIGHTALHYASLHGHKEIVQILIHAGANVNTRIEGYRDSEKGILWNPPLQNHMSAFSFGNPPPEIHMSALSSASMRGHEAIVKTLINSGADKESSGGSALVAAVSAGHESIVRTLLDSGIDVNSRESFDEAFPVIRQYEFSSLQVAAHHGNEDIVRLLLSRGANVNSRFGNFLGNALQAAQRRGFTNIMRLLIKAGANVNDDGGTGQFPLQIAVSKSNEEMVQMIIQGGADIEAQGRMALYSATSWKDENSIRLLISAGADINNGSALAEASMKGNERIFKIFVETGFLKNAVDSVKFTALCCASKTGSKDISSALLDNGAPTNLHGEDIQPLYLASNNGHSEIVELLLECGASINAHRKADGPALEGASRTGREGIVRTLLKRGADVNANSGLSLYSAARQGHESIVRILLNHSAHVNLMNDTAHTPLVGSCESGNKRIVEMLLENGADPSIVDQHGQTAFSAACAGGFMEICKILLTQGASINDVARGTLYYASKGGHDQIVQLLLELGCDVDSEYESHGRPLLVACKEGHKTVVSTLLRYGATLYGIFDQPIIAAAENGDREMVQMLRAAYQKSERDPGYQAERTRGKRARKH